MGLELEPAGRVEVIAGPDAEEHIVGVALSGIDVMEVVRHDEREPRLGRQSQELLVQPSLLGQTMVLELEIEVPGAEDVAVLAGQPPGRVPVLDLERPGDLAVEAGGQADQPLAVSGEMLAIDPRLVVVPIDVGVTDEPAQVLVAGPVLGEEDEVEGLGVGLALLVAHRPPGDIRLDAEDRLDAPGDRGLVERHSAVEGAVIREGDRVHPVRRGCIDDLADPAETVKEAEFGMDVEVREVVGSQVRHGRSMVPAQRPYEVPGCPRHGSVATLHSTRDPLFRVRQREPCAVQALRVLRRGASATVPGARDTQDGHDPVHGCHGLDLAG